MTSIEIKWADAHLLRFQNRVADLEQKFPVVLPRIINQVGARARTVVIRALTKQTGLDRRVIVKAVDLALKKATRGRLSYEMVTRGGNIRLKYLKPKETPAGVVAKPFGKTTLYPGAFMRGGHWPNRKTVPSFNGHVMYSKYSHGSQRYVTFARSGVFIPTEMTQGQTRAAFEQVAGPLLKERVEAALEKLV